ncbi:MAG: hypothetical protein IJP18_00700 [Oscillospiraceae bacterium]|nr:hypothetical protein [Oscillospiraceae bacterium]
MKETKYGVSVFEDDEIYMLAIDKELNYVPNDSELSAEIESKETIINNHYKEISEIMNAVNNMWEDV